MNWLSRVRWWHTKGDPDTCPACPPRGPAMLFSSGSVDAIPDDGRRYYPVQHLFECDCGRTHQEGQLCPYPNDRDTL